MKIVIIGAGSRSFGWGQLVDILGCDDLKGRGVTLTLVDQSPEALDRMTRFAELIRRTNGADATIESTTDRTEALPGADYVICAVARKRYELWEQDYRIPLSYGFRHCLGENGGPGALFHALRSLELVMPICRDVERLCPQAVFLNFTNPEMRVLNTILHLTPVKAYGLCHGVGGAMHQVARYAGRPVDQLKFTSAGLNHIFTLLKVEDQATGEDILPAMKARGAADPDAPPLWRKFIDLFDVFSYPSDDHIGEYVSFGWEDHPLTWHYGQECRKVSLQTSPPKRPSIEDYLEGRAQPDRWLTRPSGELAVPIICACQSGRPRWCEAVNVLNTDGWIENLPRDTTVELPAVADADGIHPQHVGALPEPFAALLRRQCEIVALTTEAWRTRSRRTLLQALLLDPCVNSLDNARRMLDEMLALQSEFLPTFE